MTYRKHDVNVTPEFAAKLCKLKIDFEFYYVQNIHLTPKWTSSWLEKRCDDLGSAHQHFRLFLSAEAAMLPINILQACFFRLHIEVYFYLHLRLQHKFDFVLICTRTFR